MGASVFCIYSAVISPVLYNSRAGTLALQLKNAFYKAGDAPVSIALNSP